MLALVSPPYLSLVVPFYNEADALEPLLDGAAAVLDGLGREWEAVLVDDGSTDDTPRLLDKRAAAAPRWRVIHLAENRGQAEALFQGLRQARGEIILTMDGDGQNDPADFPALLSKVERREADVVCGIRMDRRDSRLRRVMSRLANTVRNVILHDGVTDSGCQLRAFRREVIGALRPSLLMQSFLPAMAVAAGFRIAELPVRHHARRHGESKYGLRNLWWRPLVEMIRLRRTLPRHPHR